MKVYYAQPECSVCTYLMRAVYLANLEFKDSFTVKFIEKADDIDEESWVNLRRMFPDNKFRFPSILIDDISLYYEGIPSWLELYSFLKRMAQLNAYGGDTI